jgi:hypothetical protein
MRAIREVFFNAGVHLDRTANDLSRNFASRSIKMIPRGAGVGNIRREATKSVRLSWPEMKARNVGRTGKQRRKICGAVFDRIGIRRNAEAYCRRIGAD